MGLAGVTNEMLSRAFLKKLLPDQFYTDYSNQAAIGIFGACYKLSIFMSLAVQAFRYAAEPFFFSRAEDRNSPQLFASLMHWFVIFGLVVFLGVSLNLSWIAPVLIRNEAYWVGLAVVPVLLMANLFLGINFNLSIWYKLTDKTRFGALIAIFGAIITIVLNLLMIPRYGYMGSAYVTLIAYSSMSLLSYILGQRNYPVPYQLPRILSYLVSALLLYFSLVSWEITPLWLDAVVKSILTVAYAALLCYFEWRSSKVSQP
jgi:O-antigen/teichoic acid export membrane protein